MQACRLVITSTDYLKERAEDFGIEAHTCAMDTGANATVRRANQSAQELRAGGPWLRQWNAHS